MTSASRSRKLSTTPFVKLDSSGKTKEEELPEYIAEDFYPVYIGDVLASKYLVVAKLGFGSTSTIWLCRDVQSHQYYTLKLDGPHGKDTCLIYKPLGMSFTEFQSMSDGKTLPKAFIQRSVQLTLISLAFMHENNVIHTVLSDLGEARIGPQGHRGDIMPGIYRAPEVISDTNGIPRSTYGQWALCHRSGISGIWQKNRVLNDEQHLAEMVSLMGPPAQFLRRSQKSNEYWDSQEQSLEMRELRFSGEDRGLYLGFLRRVLRWLPEERPTAEELAYDDFLMQEILSARSLVQLVHKSFESSK
ncbi:hypothetical protein H112_02179 [Trichophyton rubrum D6]|nr:hypothetical protein H102_02174 [Trichophyton rubrum CBS 100081]EZF55213.1 hypothetical protein H103_02183 [Trichophyton rubrum CBS 288.86]EZF65848.1 hypothetical protein H104_02159 [Trichophyton rubrum CBS 289.86]EZF87108.1 hypothetical protein H110_02179 [Trichophyton rubrum MR1448]EZG19430.1 hypothetical protein H107_02248 [Trichophyton rubrum CBS 202.88]KDB36293.1 hypothetical protein H112_02179 [Trichophyton rubrum D6]